MVKRKVYLGELLSVMNAAQLYLASGYLRNNFIAVFCIENLVTTVVILVAFGPFLIKDATLKKIMYSQSEYFSSGIVALIEYSTWYKGAGMTSLNVGLAAESLCYPMSLMLMFMFVRSVREGSAKNFVIMAVAAMNIIQSICGDYLDFFDAYSGAVYLALYVGSSVSSDFITLCMTNRSGLVRFMFASSFYLGICSLFLLLGFDGEGKDFDVFFGSGSYKLVPFGIISVVSKICNALYIQRFGIIPYNTTKISRYMYFSIMKSIHQREYFWELEYTVFYLGVYLGALVLLGNSEAQERVLGFDM